MEETLAAFERAGAGHSAVAKPPRDIKRSAPVANIKSQIKRITTNEKARQRNQAIRSSVKTAVRKVREAADAGDKAKALELQKDAAKKLDKAVTKGVIHANQAANKKSAIAKRVNAL
jgi:small subunit ribosomal protein S20